MNEAAYREILDRFARGDQPPPGMALKPATVTTPTGSDPGDTFCLVDGDTAQTPILSLLGTLDIGERVMVLFWPPHGAYVVGRMGTPNASQWQDAFTVFGAGWSSFGGGLQAVQYRKEGDWTHLRGVAKRTSGVATTILTLPAGYAIQADEEDFIVLSGGVTYSGVQILPSGAVVFVPGPGASAAYVSLSGIAFCSTDFL